MADSCVGAGSSHWSADGGSCATGASEASGLASVLFGALLTSLLSSQRRLGDPSVYPPDASDHLLPHYDFAVVGAGSAGATIASRLSEDGKYSVLLVEAGGDPPADSDVVPLFWSLYDKDVNWKYTTEPEGDLGRAFKGGRRNWIRGRVLGGTSTMNSNLYMRGHKCDFDRWVSEGSPGWSYDDVLPFFKKSENFNDEEFLRNHPESQKYHSKGGPLNVQQHGFYTSLGPLVLLANEELGYRRIPEMNGKGVFGTTVIHGTIVNGTRCNTAKAFLAPAKDRHNLHVLKHTLVTKVIIDPVTKQATGLRIRRQGEVADRKVPIGKEVIVSAGSINSPQLLMLSGIGPKDHLQEMGIPIIADLPVGQNLQDHVLYPGLVISINDVHRMDPLDAAYLFLKNRTGPFTSNDITSVTTIFDTKSAPGQEDDTHNCPDAQLVYFPLPKADPVGIDLLIRVLNVVDEIAEQFHEINARQEAILVCPTLQRPVSFGEIRLKSKDPIDKPLLRAGYLTNPEDQQKLKAAIQAAVRLTKTNIFQEKGAKLEVVVPPNCKNLKFNTDDFWTCAVKEMTATMYHQTGTCKMGSDESAVVDPQLRVRGIKGLRVADASVMPSIISAATNAATIMIGEKAAHMIKETWENK